MGISQDAFPPGGPLEGGPAMYSTALGKPWASRVPFAPLRSPQRVLLCAALKERCPPRQTSREKRLKSKVKPLLTQVTVEYSTVVPQKRTSYSCQTRIKLVLRNERHNAPRPEISWVGLLVERRDGRLPPPSQSELFHLFQNIAISTLQSKGGAFAGDFPVLGTVRTIDCGCLVDEANEIVCGGGPGVRRWCPIPPRSPLLRTLPGQTPVRTCREKSVAKNALP